MKILIISGAGLSAESGISTFRESDGLWEKYDVMQVCSTQGWQQDRELVTNFYNARRADIEHKKPNAAHYYFAKLEKRYDVMHLTQNVDDMLERAGAKEVIHLHGTLTDLRCEVCHNTFYVGYRAQSEDDNCPHCGAKKIRHNVVMFGESAPNYRYIQQAIDSCDLFIAVGTSGQVIDIATIAQAFERSILINPNQEEHISAFGSFEVMIDSYFTHFIQQKASEAIEELEIIIKEYIDEA